MNSSPDLVPTRHTVPANILALAKDCQRPEVLEEFLWNWLADPQAVPRNLLDLIRTGRLQAGISLASPGDEPHEPAIRWADYHGYRDEDPYLWLLRQLPTLSNPTRPQFCKILAARLGEVFNAMAVDSQLRSSMHTLHWSALIDFAHRICIPDSLGEGVARLQQLFDEAGELPYPGDSILAHEFVRLLGRVQPDNSLAPRWANLLGTARGEESSADATLPADALTAWRAICLLPQDTIEFPWVQQSLEILCANFDAQNWPLETKTKLGQKIAEAPTLHLRIYRKLALAALWKSYQWLPKPDVLTFLVAIDDDLGFLGELRSILSHGDSDEGILVDTRYRLVAKNKKIEFSSALKSLIGLQSVEKQVDQLLTLQINQSSPEIQAVYETLKQAA